MKEQEPQVTDQKEQPIASEHLPPTSKNGVFMMRGKGQSWEEFKKACIESLISAGLIKEGPRQLRAGSGSPSSEQILPDGKDQQ